MRRLFPCLLLLFTLLANADDGIIPSPNQIYQGIQKSLSIQSSSASQAGYITFDDYPVNTPITNQFEAQGVIFNQSFIELDNAPDIIYLSGDNESYPTPYGNGQNAAPITANFLAPTGFVEADPIYLDVGSIMTINVFDKNGAEIGSASGSGRLRVEATGITKAVFTFHNQNKIDDIAGIDNLAFSAPPLVSIDRATLETNSINITLSGLGLLAPSPLIIELVGNNGSFKTNYNNGENLGDGAYVGKLDRPTIPEDTYSRIIATWKLSTGDVVSKDYILSPVWKVLGLVRHSQYNTPSESACAGNAKSAWVFDSNCNFTETTLDSKFAKQVYINGTGRSLQHGIIKYSKMCSTTYPQGANAKNSFLLVDEITGSCNKAMTNTYQAAYPNPGTAATPRCGDNTLLVESNDTNKAEKEIQDYCPACKDRHHIDNYTDIKACSGGAVGDYGDFWTANIGAN